MCGFVCWIPIFLCGFCVCVCVCVWNWDLFNYKVKKKKKKKSYADHNRRKFWKAVYISRRFIHPLRFLFKYFNASPWFPVPCTNRKYISLHITCAFRLQKVDVKVLVAQWCPTACYPMDCNPPGSSVHEVLQARILEWVASPFSRGSSQSSDRTQISCIAGTLFTT